jgi:hypothetical protein
LNFAPIVYVNVTKGVTKMRTSKLALLEQETGEPLEVIGPRAIVGANGSVNKAAADLKDTFNVDVTTSALNYWLLKKGLRVHVETETKVYVRKAEF